MDMEGKKSTSFTNDSVRKKGKDEEMITVWEWVGICLGVYGIIIILAGIVYGPHHKFGVNISLLAGTFITLFSFAMFFGGRANRKNSKGKMVSAMFYIFSLIFFSNSSFAQEKVDVLKPYPSLEGTAGLFRITSTRTLGFRNISIGTFFGFYDTPNNKIIVISRDYFALKEARQRVNFETFNSYGFYNYIFIASGLPRINVGGFISGDISLAMRNSSINVRSQFRGMELSSDNVQVLGDFIISPKVAYTFERGDLAFGFSPKVYLLSAFRAPRIQTVSFAPTLSFLYDFDENPTFRSDFISALNPRLHFSFSYSIDNSRLITQNVNVPSFIETQMFIEPSNHFDFGVGAELGDSRSGISRYISGFLEWSLIIYSPIPSEASFSDMPMYFSLGVRSRPIPLISEVISGIPQEIQDLAIFIAGDFNLSREFSVSFPFANEVILRNSPFWRLFFGFNLIWNPWERRAFLGEGGRVRFKVLDDATGNPVQDAIVSYPDLDLSNQATDASGNVLAYELPPGEWSVVFRKEGYEPYQVKVLVEKGKLKDVEVRLKKEVQFSSVYGTVSSQDGKPLPARFEVEGANIPPVFSDPSNGRFEIVLPSGTHKIKVSAQGYNSTEFQVNLSPGEKKAVDILLEPIKEVIELKGGEKALGEVERKIIIEKATNRILLPEKILFAPGEADVLPSSVEILKALADFIQREVKGKKIRIEVHTDPIKNKDYDRELTQRRAEKVADTLAQFGVPKENLIPIGKGSEFPIASNETPEGRALNRRVDFFIEK
ncbi:Outer membrane porin F [bacterium HR19]|nr:Outer membrane porin F [bacterium HR19]